MICDRILGNLDSFEPIGDREIDAIDFDWTESRRRFLRKRSNAGRSVGLLLSVGTILRHDDVCFAGERVVIVAHQRPCRAIFVRPANAALAYELGQQHSPVEIRADALVMPEDDVMAAWLARKGVAFTVELTRFVPIANDLSVSASQLEIAYEGPQAGQRRRRALSV
jgi:urease accessory protein UreE